MCLYINVLIESVEKFLIARTVADIPTNGKQMLRGALETDDSMGETAKLAFFSLLSLSLFPHLTVFSLLFLSNSTKRNWQHQQGTFFNK